MSDNRISSNTATSNQKPNSTPNNQQLYREVTSVFVPNPPPFRINSVADAIAATKSNYRSN
jgi:hypothetical protein